MKTVGIIGGLGPETTTKFYMEIVFSCSKIRKQRPNILISNVAVPLLVEEEIIKDNKNEEKILPFLINSAKQLEKGGADFIVIPCNTVHVFINEIRNSVNIPVLSIIEETSKFLAGKHLGEIGLLATGSTIKNKLFVRDALCGIRVKNPSKLQQNKINDIIHHLVDNIDTDKDKTELTNIMKDLKINHFLLACTDLQLISEGIDNSTIFDTMNILAKATVKEMFS